MIPLIIAWLGKSAIRRMLKFREDIIFHIQDWISDCQFAAFIAEEADAFDKIHEFMTFMDKLIKAYIFMIPLPVLVSYASDEMVKDPVLNAYFSQFPSVREHIKLIDAHAPYAFTGYDEQLLDNLARLFPGGEKTVEKMKEEHANILDFFKLLWKELENYFIDIGEDPQSFTNHVLQDMGQSTYPAEFWHIPKELVWFLNPFIAIDWVMIKTAIQCYYSFEKYALNGELAKYPQPFIPGQWIWLQQNSNILAKTELDAEGHFTLEGSFEGEFWKDIAINSHGLLFLDEIAKLCSLFDLYCNESGQWINGCETKWTSFNIFTTPEFEHYFILWFEDMKGDPNPDMDYDDVFIRIKDADTGYYEVEIGSYHALRHNDIYFRKTFLCHCPTASNEEKIAWKGKINKKTLTII